MSELWRNPDQPLRPWAKRLGEWSLRFWPIPDQTVPEVMPSNVDEFLMLTAGMDLPNHQHLDPFFQDAPPGVEAKFT